ncbi:MAG: hypothetical protein LLG04_03120, partial [Parachlamydia sp.]|nr:hypothetical protein [Parachlamydia sp.]
MSAITFANSSQFHDTFVGKVIHHESAYVEIHAKHGKTTYAISDHIDARINDYTFDTFQKIEHEIQNETDAYKLMEWKEVAEMVYVNYKIQQKDDHPNWLQRLVTKLLTTLHITHTQDEVEKEFHQLEHLLEERYQLKPHVQTYLESYQYMQQKLEERIDRREAHRKPEAALVARYDERALSNVFIAKRVKEMTETSPEVKQFDALIKEQKTLEGRIKEIQGGGPEKELGELAKVQQRLQEIVRQDPYAKKQIKVAHIKERATLEVYEQELPKRIKEGCYDPAVIPEEIKLVLGVGDAIPSGIKDNEDDKNHIHDELKRFKAEGKIKKHQLKYV